MITETGGSKGGYRKQLKVYNETQRPPTTQKLLLDVQYQMISG